MATGRRTYRDADGLRVEGTWRHVFIRNVDTYYLTDLIVYADGAIDCGAGGLTDLAGLRRELRTGRVATALPDGAWASAHALASWRFADPHSGLDAAMLAGEVADEIDRLNDRPDSIARCRLALEAYLRDLTEDNRLALRERYLAIPEHRRQYALGDMDRQDGPLRVLVTEPGTPAFGDSDGSPVTPEDHADALAYFRDRELEPVRWRDGTRADGPETAEAPALTLYRRGYPAGWPDDPGRQVLQNDYPAPIEVNGRTYPSVTHAYWALSTSEPHWHDRIAAASQPYDAMVLAEAAPRRPHWAAGRLAVMAALLRSKYTQHPRLARTLLGTGDASIGYVDFDSAYWITGGSRGGSNWIGRLLQVVRSELAAADTGLPLG